MSLPAHGEITGSMQQRVGIDRQRHAIRFHMRLPRRSTGRFFFEGGGGTEGKLGAAIGRAGRRGGKIGPANGAFPGIDAAMGAPALAAVFRTPHSPYPKIARYVGSGSVEEAGSFRCE